ncbi:hypothetical protein [Stetteria hydrogenophila]
MSRILSLVVVALIIAAPIAGLVAGAARSPGLVILVDMSHGQNPGGLDYLMKLVPEAYWIVLVASEADVASLPESVLKLADEVRVGGFTPDNLNGVDMVIIGQPTLLPDPMELQALADWFNDPESPRAVWVAADSDYPAQGSETAQQFANQVLEALGSRLRVDYVSVEDQESYAGKTYRVVGIVDPTPKDRPSALLAYVASKVLFHGPGAVYALDDNGNPVNPLETPVPNVCVIVRTSDSGVIVEHQTADSGGLSGVLYHAGDTGRFPLLAIERVKTSPLKTVVASGESPYSGYQSMATWLYHGVRLDGPSFVRNLIFVALGYFAPLKSLQALNGVYSQLQAVQSDLESAKSSLEGAMEGISSLNAKVNQLEAKISQLEGQLSDASQKAEAAQQAAVEAKNAADSAAGKAGNALALAVLALIVALGAAGLVLTRK